MSNRVTIDQLLASDVAALAALTAPELHMLQDDIEALSELSKSAQEKFFAAVHRKYSDAVAVARHEQGKETGSVVIGETDGLVVVCNATKDVTWDQAGLARAEAGLVEMGEDPIEYIKTERKVEERKFTGWPKSLQSLFMPHRTVSTKKPTYKIEAREPRAGAA